MPDNMTLGLFRSIHKTTPGYDAGPIVDDAAVAGVLYPDFHLARNAIVRLVELGDAAASSKV